MKEIRKDLKAFSLTQLNKIRELISQRNYGFDGPDKWLFDELECVLHCNQKSFEWERMEGDMILGEVWRQRIGEYYHKHSVHRFEYMYVKDCLKVIDEHGPHREPVHRGSQYKKVREFYIFPDGTVKLCRKDETHYLFNPYGEPIYVISVKIGSKSH